jgi:hypothetical protein
MVRVLKFILPVALVVASCAVISSASAAEFHSESESGTHLHGEQQEENTFVVNSRVVKCTGVTTTAFTTGWFWKSWKQEKKYTGCTGFGLAATLAMNGCEVEFGEPVGSGPWTGTTGVVCPVGKSIAISIGSGSCLVTIGSQSGLAGVSYTNTGSGGGRSIKMTYNVTTLSANVSGSVLVCGTNGTRTASYTGSDILEGFTNSGLGTHVGIWVE